MREIVSFILFFSISILSLYFHVTDPFDPDDMFYEHAPDSRQSDSISDSESDDPYGERKRHQVNYVYDAAAERTKQRIKEGLLAKAALEAVPGH